jgi:phosphoserine phosphatase RsbU/P
MRSSNRSKAAPALRDIPIIMISALDEIDSVIRCIELGAEDYLNKPFNPTLLRARVGASLEKKRLRDAVRRNLERLEQELDSARALQLAMLPNQFPACSPSHPVAVHAVMQPAKEVGGDLYDCFYAGEHTFCFLVGDVSGKGASAAMFMARARSLVRITVNLMAGMARRRHRSRGVDGGGQSRALPEQRRQNVRHAVSGVDRYADRLVSFINAGHPPPHLLSRTGETKQIDAKPALPLGVRRQACFQTRTLAIQPGDALFVCSDGVFEALNDKGTCFRSSGLSQLLREANAAEPLEMVRVIKDAVDAFTGTAPRADDVTALALRWQPAESTAERPIAWAGA